MFNTYPVSKHLRPYVSFFYDFDWDEKDYENGIKELILPSGQGFMVFQTHGRFRGLLGSVEVPVPQYYTIGQQTRTYTLFTNHEKLGIIGAALTPTGIYKLFGICMEDMVNRPTPTRNLFGSDFDLFCKEFENIKGIKERITLIEKLLETRLDKVTVANSIVDLSIDLMNKSLGCLPINHISKSLNISLRYFQKKFKEIVGVSPSVYNRIVRFNNLFSEYDLKTSTDYKVISALFEYYDYSHFHRDFKKYCGETPKAFHIEKFNFIKEAFVNNPIFLQRIK
ncbi:MAG: AraC family transcriptional regulator [Flavobacteriaceae bacterium]